MAVMQTTSPASKNKPAPYGLSRPDEAWVAKTLKQLSLRDKIAQLIQVRVTGRFRNRLSPEFREIEQEIRQNHIGGVVLFAGNVYESALLLNDLQTISKLPLLVSSDFERGASLRVADTTSFPWSMAIGATGSENYAYQEGAITAREARALGVHWIFAPVMDVNNNPDNPVINVRSYGEDPRTVARLGSAFIRGARDNGVLTTAKHFPGHGDTAVDSHIGLPVIGSDQERLDSVELVPFRSAVEAGVDSIMTAHIAVPQITGNPSLPATLSPQILTELLRDRLKFSGLIVTDALEMGGITTRYWSGLAAIRALQAGADTLLLPTDTNVTINEVARAVKRGDIPEARIDESVKRLLAAKTRLGLHLRRTVATEQIEKVVAAPENQQIAQEMANHSITLLRDENRLVPLDPRRDRLVFSLVLSSEPDSAPGAAFQAEMRRRFTSIRTASVDTRLSDDVVDRILKDASEADVIVCATLVSVVTGKGSISLGESQRTLLEKILAYNKPVIWVAFGNPYVLSLYPQARTYICTFSHADVSQIAAARALSGAVAIGGKTPVSIPSCARAGDGLVVPRLDMTLKHATPDSMGLPPSAFEETKRLLASFVSDHSFPSASLIVGYHGAIVLDAAAGPLENSPESPRANADTIYDLDSLSQVVGTTSAAMMQVEAGRLLLNAAVQDYLPEFQGSNKNKVKVRDLLTHTAGLPASLPFYKTARGYTEVLKKVYDTPLEFDPGSRTQYSDLGLIMLGEIISRAAGYPLDRFLSQRLFTPLGMTSTMYRPSKSLLERIAATGNDPWRNRTVRGEVHDENAFAMGGVSGNAGLFSSARDLAVFSQMLLNGGLYDHRRYLKPGTIVMARATGWQKPAADRWTGRVFTGSAFGHSGIGGTSLWIDPGKQLFIILLSNGSGPEPANDQIENARKAICESIVKAVTDAQGK